MLKKNKLSLSYGILQRLMKLIKHFFMQIMGAIFLPLFSIALRYGLFLLMILQEWLSFH